MVCRINELAARADRLLAFGVVAKRDGPPVVVPTGIAPVIHPAEDGSGHRRVDDGAFALLPHPAKGMAYGRKTYNARSKTVATLNGYRCAWGRGNNASSRLKPSLNTSTTM